MISVIGALGPIFVPTNTSASYTWEWPASTRAHPTSRPSQHGICLTRGPDTLRGDCIGIVRLRAVLPRPEEVAHARPPFTPGTERLAGYWEHVRYTGVSAVAGLSRPRRRVRCVIGCARPASPMLTMSLLCRRYHLSPSLGTAYAHSRKCSDDLRVSRQALCEHL